MNNLQLNITIKENQWQQQLPKIEAVAETVLNTTLNYVQNNEEIDFLSFNKPICINLALSNDKEVHQLNATFRHIDKPTNVLSFANIDNENFEEDIKLFNEIELGDIIIALETMQREAAEKNISLQNHFCHLFTHGILHLLGFDHIEDDEAEYMEDFEVNILKAMNIANPYQE